MVVKFELIQVENKQLAKFGTNATGILFSWRDNSSSRVNTLGPLCLWQCFYLKLILQEWMIYFILYKGFRFLSIYSRQIAEKYGSSAMCQLEDSLVLWGVNVACFTLISVCVTYEIFGTSIPHICRPCHPWRQCKNIKRRGIFSYWMRLGTLLILHIVCNFAHDAQGDFCRKSMHFWV